MDFTFLFLIVLMLFAVKSGLEWVAFGLAILLFVTAKNAMGYLAATVGVATVVLAYFFGNTDFSIYIIGGGLGLVLLILAKRDSDAPQQYSPMMGEM